MKRQILFLTGPMLICNMALGQNKVIKIQLTQQNISIKETPQFHEIIPKGFDKHQYKIPADLQDSYTLSRYIVFNSGKRTIRIPVLLAMDTIGTKTIIIDKNQDFSFLNDKREVLDAIQDRPYTKKWVEDSLTLGQNKNATYYFRYIFQKPKFVSTDYKDNVENQFFLMIADNNSFSKVFVRGKSLSKVIVYASNPLDYSKNSLRLSISKDTNGSFQFKGNEKFIAFKVGDSLFLNGLPYCFEDFDTDKRLLTLKKLSDKKIFNSYPGFFAHNFSIDDINHNRISLNDYIGNYILIEFWGTWCLPCKTITPKLKDLYDKYKQKKMKIISIAYDDELQKVQQYVKENDIKWTNIFQKMDIKNSEIIRKYKVEDYPTYVLVEPSGKIIFRDYGIDGFDNLNNLIKKIDLLQ